MARKSDQRIRMMVGLFVVVLSILLFISLFMIGQSEGTWERKTFVKTDFRTITGLRKGSPVQLAGVEVGTVESIDFVSRRYECDYLTEDVGRFGAGRTDNCDQYTFCSPDQLCAALEPFASKGAHNPCLTSDDCADEEVCVTKGFRRRARRVFWAGPDGVCARYTLDHRRVEVTMNVFQDKLEIIRSDSRASVASNGVLGDQLVNITPGMREQLGEERRIQSTPSLYEDINLFRERIDGLTDKVDTSLSGIATLFSELNDERTIEAIKGTLENANEISRQLAEGEGLLGQLLNSDEYKAEFSKTLRSARNTAQGIDKFVQRANGTLKKVDDNVQPAVDDFRKFAGDITKTLDDLKDPANKSVAAKLLYDEDGKVVTDIKRIVSDVEETTKSAKVIAQRIESGKGTLGKLVNDPKAHDALVKIFSDLERNNTYKRMARYVIEMDEKKGKRRARRKSEKSGNTAKKDD